MRQQAVNYAKVLYELVPDKEAVELLEAICKETPQMIEVLNNPVVPLKKKESIIEKVARKAGFSAALKNFLKYLCRSRDIGLLPEITKAYLSVWEEAHNILRAQLLYAAPPKQEELEKALEFLSGRYPGKEIKTVLIIDENLLGGLCIRVGQEEFDWSFEGKLQQLERKFTVR